MLRHCKQYTAQLAAAHTSGRYAAQARGHPRWRTVLKMFQLSSILVIAAAFFPSFCAHPAVCFMAECARST